MEGNGNGIPPGSRPVAAAGRLPRRLVLLAAGEDSEVNSVLREYQGKEVSGQKLHADLQELAQEHQGRIVAAEWQGPLGWTRFLWCQK